jgi:hypothetical protein
LFYLSKYFSPRTRRCRINGIPKFFLGASHDRVTRWGRIFAYYLGDCFLQVVFGK